MSTSRQSSNAGSQPPLRFLRVEESGSEDSKKPAPGGHNNVVGVASVIPPVPYFRNNYQFPPMPMALKEDPNVEKMVGNHNLGVLALAAEVVAMAANRSANNIISSPPTNNMPGMRAPAMKQPPPGSTPTKRKRDALLVDGDNTQIDDKISSQNIESSKPQRVWNNNKKECSAPNCPNQANFKGGVCRRHRALCSFPNCTNPIVNHCVCMEHGAIIKKCDVGRCDNYVVKGVGACAACQEKVNQIQAQIGGVGIKYDPKVNPLGGPQYPFGPGVGARIIHGAKDNLSQARNDGFVRHELKMNTQGGPQFGQGVGALITHDMKHNQSWARNGGFLINHEEQVTALGAPRFDCQLKVKEDLPHLEGPKPTNQPPFGLISSSVPQKQPLCGLITNNVESNTSSNIPRAGVAYPTRLSIPFDEQFLDPVHRFLRSSCVEVFVCGGNMNPKGLGRRAYPQTETHVRGQVGLRCPHCQHIPKSNRANQAVSYPSKLGHIYESVRNFQRIHFEACEYIPSSLKKEYMELVSQTQSSKKIHRKYIKVYFAEAAREIGMVESPYGLFFGAPPNTSGTPSKKLQAVMTIAQNPSACERRQLQDLLFPKIDERVKNSKFSHIASARTQQVIESCRQEEAAFIYPSDFPTVSDFRFVLFHQFVPCRPPASKLERRKTVPKNWDTLSGLWCKHCAKAHHCHGMYCPLDFNSFCDSSFFKYITSHILSCNGVPIATKEALNELHMLAAEHGSTTKRGAKTLFLKKVWDRMTNHYPPRSREEMDQTNLKVDWNSNVH
eukprot:scaffold6108_cov119-Skeletonema_menzelii.AAC.7